MPDSKPLRYAHSDGHTDVCYEDSGRYILTCGSDGDVRIWDGIDDDDAISNRCGDKVFAIAYKGNRYFTASDSNTVQLYTFPDGAPDGIVVRFTAPANHIVVNESGDKMVACSSDFSLKVVNVSDCSHRTCQGHEAPVLSVAMDPKEEFVASSSCDGTVRIWKLSDCTHVHSMNVIPKCNLPSLSKTMCRLSWELKNGEFLYVPVEKEVQIYERNSWNLIGSLTEGSVSQFMSVMAFSPDGQYLATGSSDGWICVFDVKSRKCVDKHRNEKGLSITAVAWNPKNNMELAFCDNQGQLGLLSNISTSGPTDAGDASSAVPEGVFDDEDDDFLVQATNEEPGDDSDNDMDTESGIKFARPNVVSDDEDSNMELRKPDGGDDDDASSMTSDLPVPPPKPEVRVEGYKPTPMQRPFQPGSTPEHLSSRFMVWNSVGVVRQYNSEEENSVDIEFHDTSVHHAMHISNSQNYTMADLSREAVLLGSEGDSDNASKLTCMHFSSWDNNKEWSVTMPDGEEIRALALGEGWAAVATDLRNVRIFSVGGVQKELFSLPGPVVCMSGHGSVLMVVYHRGMGIPGDQCFGVTVQDIQEWRGGVVCELPVSAKSTLSWLGFSAEGTPFFMDSSGIVRMMNRKASNTWVQVADTRQHAKGKSDHYWIVGVHENPQQLRCIPCKGARYPPTLPRPAVTILPFQVPVCEQSSEKAQYEELLWRTRLLTGHFDQWERQGYEVDEEARTDARRPVQEALMKLFALSARSEREYRALEVCEMMTDQHTLQLAIKYSSRMRYLHLAQRIGELAGRKAEEEQQKQYTEQYEDTTPSRGCQQRFAAQVNAEEDEPQDREEVTMEEGGEESEPTHTGPMLNIKSKEERTEKSLSIAKSQTNPFKVSTPHTTPGTTKGTQVFDNLSKKKEKPVLILGSQKSRSSGQKAVTKKTSQPKLFMKKKSESTAEQTPSVQKEDEPPVQKTATPFDLWLTENKERLQAEQPDEEDLDFNKFAAEQFRALPKEERQGWLKKAKAMNEKSKENEAEPQPPAMADSPESKKRKLEDTNDDDVKKSKTLIGSTEKKKPLSQSTNSKLANFAFQKEDN